MNARSLRARYEMAIPEFEMVNGDGPFSEHIAGPPQWIATVRRSDTGLLLQIEFNTLLSQDESVRIADAYAQRVADHLTFALSDEVGHSVSARRINTDFKDEDENIVYIVHEAPPWSADGTVKVRLTNCVESTVIADALSGFRMTEAAAPLPFTADLAIARQMYLAALRVESPVARFLIIYAAMAVFARFKRGAATQTSIDAVLQSEDPTLPTHPSPKGTGTETEFTRARNAFIHAEDRGRDPTAAMAVIETLATTFQIFVGLILRKG